MILPVSQATTKRKPSAASRIRCFSSWSVRKEGLQVPSALVFPVPEANAGMNMTILSHKHKHKHAHTRTPHISLTQVNCNILEKYTHFQSLNVLSLPLPLLILQKAWQIIHQRSHTSINSYIFTHKVIHYGQLPN